MKYKGKLYGRLGHDVYVPLEETTEDYDLLKDRLDKAEEDRSNFIQLVERLSDIIEENKDKKYTEEDMRRCWNACQIFERPKNEGYAPNFEEFIQLLKYKNEKEK